VRQIFRSRSVFLYILHATFFEICSDPCNAGWHIRAVCIGVFARSITQRAAQGCHSCFCVHNLPLGSLKHRVQRSATGRLGIPGRSKSRGAVWQAMPPNLLDISNNHVGKSQSRRSSCSTCTWPNSSPLRHSFCRDRRPSICPGLRWRSVAAPRGSSRPPSHPLGMHVLAIGGHQAIGNPNLNHVQPGAGVDCSVISRSVPVMGRVRASGSCVAWVYSPRGKAAAQHQPPADHDQQPTGRFRGLGVHSAGSVPRPLAPSRLSNRPASPQAGVAGERVTTGWIGCWPGDPRAWRGAVHSGGTVQLLLPVCASLMLGNRPASRIQRSR